MEGRDPRNGGLQPTDPSTLRISDADRHQVSEVLRQAAGEGRLELEELDERLEATFRAAHLRRPGPDHRGPAAPRG